MRTVASFIVGVGLTTQACSTVVPVQGADTSDLVGAGADEGSEDEEVAEDTFEAADLDTAGEGTKDSGAGKDSGDTGTSNPQDSGWDSGLGAYDTAGCGYGYVLDCDGACGDAYSNVGDGYCDGVSGSVYGNWDCATWSYDGGDCLVDTGIDRGIRGREKPSDHVPVWAELDL